VGFGLREGNSTAMEQRNEDDADRWKRGRKRGREGGRGSTSSWTGSRMCIISFHMGCCSQSDERLAFSAAYWGVTGEGGEEEGGEGGGEGGRRKREWT